MPQDQTSKRDADSVKKFLALAHDRFRLAAEAEADWRRDGLDDLKFSIGDQWDTNIKQKRDKDNKPCLTINRAGQNIKQVANNQRQQRPAIQVNPAGNGSSKEVADILQGMIRHIEVQSDAEVVYDMAFDYMVRTGKCPFRIRADYADDDPESDDQELFIELVPNPFMLYGDPNAQRPDKSDSKWKFIVRDMSPEEYRADYGDSDMAKMSDSQLSSVGDSVPGWARKDNIRVAEYFHIELKKQGEKYKTQVKWAKINAIEILDERDLPGKYIPIPEVVGDDLIVDGKRYIAGLIRDAKEPCRVYNYEVTAAVEVLMLQPKTPYVGVKGQFTDPKWETANTENYAYLEYEPIDIFGNPAPPPARSSVATDITSIVMMIRQSDNDIKATTGLYDASLGERGPEQSGKAILQRKQQGDNAVFNYTDNLVRTMRFAGRILLDLIPKYYDAPRVQRIINPDGSADHVGIYNSKAQAGENFDPEAFKEERKIQKIYDIGMGKYDVTVSVGPSYQTKRQEAAATQIELMKSVPIVQQAAPDVVIRNMDIPGSDVIADRVKKLLPPQLQDDGDSSPEGQLQKVQAQLQAVTQQHDMLTQALQQANQIIETKQVESNAKIAIAKIDSATRIAVAEITTKAQDARARAQIEADELGQAHDAAHELGMNAVQHGQAKELNQQQADNTQAQQSQDQQFQAQQASEGQNQ